MLRGRSIQRRSRGGEARLMRGKDFFFLQPNSELLLDVIYMSICTDGRKCQHQGKFKWRLCIKDLTSNFTGS